MCIFAPKVGMKTCAANAKVGMKMCAVNTKVGMKMCVTKCQVRCYYLMIFLPFLITIPRVDASAGVPLSV